MKYSLGSNRISFVHCIFRLTVLYILTTTNTYASCVTERKGHHSLLKFIESQIKIKFKTITVCKINLHLLVSGMLL